MDFEQYKNADGSSNSQPESTGYDMSAVATTESEMKVPPPMSFTDPAPLTRSVMAVGPELGSEFGQAEMEGPDNYESNWGYDDFQSLAPPAKLSSTDSFGMGPSKLSSTDGFEVTKTGGPSLGFAQQTMYIEQVQARALDPEPIYYEKYSSFTSTSSPQVLLGDIAKVLTERSNVDHEPCLDKNKIKGVAYENNGRCTFKIRLYQSSLAGAVLCEFQRRSGCVVSFNKFYRRTIADIASHVSRKAGEKSGNWINNINRIEAQQTAEPTVQLDSATAANLISMAACDNVDVQREGAQALASVVKFATNQVKLAEIYTQSPQESRIVELLQKLLTSVDVELCRSGCVILSSLAAQDSMKSVLVHSLLEKMLSVFDAPASFETTDCKRQVAQALSLLSNGCAAEIVGLSCGQRCVDLLKKYMRAYDASFQQSVISALDFLQHASQ